MKSHVHIRRMRLTDIPSVSAIHMRVLPTPTARLGHAYLSLLYKTLLDNSTLHTMLVATRKTAVVAAITATKDLHQTQRQLQSASFQPAMIFHVVGALCSGRVSPVELLERILTERKILAAFPKRYPTVLTFFVDTPWQHQGIGARLVSDAKRSMRETRLFVDTERKNVPAQRWYKTHGFTARKTIGNTIVFEWRKN